MTIFRKLRRMMRDEGEQEHIISLGKTIVTLSSLLDGERERNAELRAELAITRMGHAQQQEKIAKLRSWQVAALKIDSNIGIGINKLLVEWEKEVQDRARDIMGIAEA